MITITKDIEFSHSFLSYLLAGLQGQFAYLNILDRIGGGASKIEQEDLETLQEQIKKADLWLTNTLEGKPLFQLQWKDAITPASKEALATGEAFAKDLETLAFDLSSILKQRQFHENSKARIALLLSALGRHIYSRDNYLRLFYAFYKEVGDKEESTRYRTGVKSSERDVEYTNSLIAAFERHQDLPIDFYHALFMEVVALPGLLRTQACDVRMLASVYKGAFTYALARISEEHAAEWQHIGITPMEAGTWEAQQIPPHEALDWIQREISNPALAGLWRAWRFSSQEAAKWLHEEFGPKDAADWANAGFDPTEARQLINRGVSHPSLIKG